ncbi:hypothetical protein AAF712_004849 [Marasmius tenuissimus]|uniref:Uncharacterized protein n=1 Tax=Marasmius tenuissimus TaxID=585030 RepID=A0ABR3A4D8_9AGAR
MFNERDPFTYLVNYAPIKFVLSYLSWSRPLDTFFVAHPEPAIRNYVWNSIPHTRHSVIAAFPEHISQWGIGRCDLEYRSLDRPARYRLLGECFGDYIRLTWIFRAVDSLSRAFLEMATKYGLFCYVNPIATLVCGYLKHVISSTNLESLEKNGPAVLPDVVELTLTPIATEEHHSSEFRNQINPERHAPYYLFIRPLIYLSDGFPDLTSWTTSAPMRPPYYWSLDSAGRVALSDTECSALGLPLLLPSCDLKYRTFQPEVYDFVGRFLEAKGFNPTSTDFAESLGYPKLPINNLAGIESPATFVEMEDVQYT